VKKYFIKHPNSVDETYLQHWFFAIKTGFSMMTAGFACIIHGFFPFVFINTGSRQVYKLAEKFSKRCLKIQLNDLHIATDFSQKLKETSDINE